MELLEHFMSRRKHLEDFQKIGNASQFQHKTFKKYDKYFGSGVELKENFIKYNMSFEDINGIFQEEKIPYVVKKRKILAFFKNLFKK
jgi:hypothetical protein